MTSRRTTWQVFRGIPTAPSNPYVLAGTVDPKEISMRLPRALSIFSFTVLLVAGGVSAALCQQRAETATHGATATPDVAVGPQYDSTHVYVAPEDFDRFVGSLVATFGGAASKKVVTHVTPTPSSSFSQMILTPVGSISAFGFTTPIPYPSARNELDT
jgi:hypothetical protein